MSNIFNQQLTQALTSVNSSLEQSELTQQNSVKSSKLGLYYAHGLTSKSENQLEEDQAKSAGSAEQNKVAAIGTTTSQNILTAANAAVLDASNTTSSASAAAASIQKAATALTNLSGSVATTLAVATSLDKGSKIQKLVEKANKATKEAARLAEEASLIALDLTIEASQSRAAGVVTQAGTVKANMTTLQKSLSDTFSKQQDVITEDLSVMNSAIVSESEQAGVYKTSLAEDKAIRSSQTFINKHINNDLTCDIPGINGGQVTGEGSTGDQFKLSFTAFNEKESGVEIISEYRIIIVKEDDASAFNTEAAKSILPRNYVKIVPDGSVRYSQTYITPDYISLNENVTVGTIIARDYSGLPVVRGVPYTFFVYVVYTPAYQTHYNDTNGLLSLPSPIFTLKTSLPVVASNNVSMLFYQKDAADAVRIAFKVPARKMSLTNGTDLNELMEFRTFIFSDKDREAFIRNKQIDAASNKLFAMEQEYRLKEERYQTVEQAYNTAIAQGASEAEIQQLKNELDIAKAQYQAAKADYNDQIKVVDQLNQGKISDFYIDEEIVESIPASDYIVAKENKNLLSELAQRKDEMTKQLASFKEQSNSNTSKLKELNDEVSVVTKDMNDALKQEDPMQDQIRKLQQELADYIAQLETIHNEKIKIKSEKDAEEFRKQIRDEQSEQSKLLDAIIANFKKLSEIEVTEISLSTDINAWRSELKKLNTEIVLITAQQEMVKDELNTLPDDIQKLSDQLEQLSKGEAGEDYDYYEAVNESGDFTDNYGEPLVTGDLYCAVILSAIKDSEPEAATLYQNRMSGFSESVRFRLEQI